MSYTLYVVSKSVFYTLSIRSPAFNCIKMAWVAGLGPRPRSRPRPRRSRRSRQGSPCTPAARGCSRTCFFFFRARTAVSVFRGKTYLVRTYKHESTSPSPASAGSSRTSAFIFATLAPAASAALSCLAPQPRCIEGRRKVSVLFWSVLFCREHRWDLLHSRDPPVAQRAACMCSSAASW